MLSNHVLAAALWYASRIHSDPFDIESYASLVTYLATGWYSGFGTEHYEKEHRAENIILALADGMVAPPDNIPVAVPDAMVKRTPSAEFTRLVLKFLDTFYFGAQEQAVTDLLNSVDDKTAARIVLNLAQTQTEYDHLVKMADRFLKKKENISSLRKAVRKVLNKKAESSRPKSTGSPVLKNGGALPQSLDRRN